jgi:hypothetical protein
MLTSAILLLVLLQVKHLVMDWFWQTSYELENKGTYNHLGGHQHASKHALATVLCFLPFCLSQQLLITVFVIDYLAHYHIDWAKMQINKHAKWTPTDSNFWNAIGFDQFLHQITYLFLVWYYMT